MVGVRGGGADSWAYVWLEHGDVHLYKGISHDGKDYKEARIEGVFMPLPGSVVTFRVSPKGGGFTVEMKVEGDGWSHITPNGDPLLPKDESGRAMDGLRMFVGLYGAEASVSSVQLKKRDTGACVPDSATAARPDTPQRIKQEAVEM